MCSGARLFLHKNETARGRCEHVTCLLLLERLTDPTRVLNVRMGVSEDTNEEG